MRKILSLALVVPLSAGCTTLPTSSSNGLDNYEVQWSGNTGSKLFGSYVIASKTPGVPVKVEKVIENIPFKTTFSAPKNTLISVAGNTVNQGKVTIKIFRNGLECGKTIVVGSGAIANQTCQ